jgi:hypothetical protein
MTAFPEEKERDFDPKPCPKRAYKNAPIKGAIVSGAAASLTESHRSELNRRPVLSGTPQFSGIWRLFNEITRRISAFQGRKTGKSRPETVPETCLFSGRSHVSLTNPLLHFRFSPEGQMALERAAREEIRQFAFRRGS